jgi:hypothetical protein
MVYKESEKRRIDGKTYVPAYSTHSKEQANKNAKDMRKDGWAIRIRATHPKVNGKKEAFYTLYTLATKNYHFRKD